MSARSGLVGTNNSRPHFMPFEAISSMDRKIQQLTKMPIFLPCQWDHIPPRCQTDPLVAIAAALSVRIKCSDKITRKLKFLKYRSVMPETLAMPSWPFFIWLQSVVSTGRTNARNIHVSPIFLVGPMPFWWAATDVVLKPWKGNFVFLELVAKDLWTLAKLWQH